MIQARQEDLTTRIAELASKVLAGGQLSRDEAHDLTRVQGDDLYDLFFWANKIRLKFVGRHVKFCSIAAGKVGACSEDCAYCSQSAHYDTGIEFSKLTLDEMEQATDQAVANGASSFGIVNSGRGPTQKELDWLRPYYEKLREKGNVCRCATLGDLTPDQAQQLKDMGVLKINHNLETSRANFGNVISTHTYDDRVRTIRNASEAGLEICAGGIFGMGEDWNGRIDMAMDLRELGVHGVPINFLDARKGTPMYGRYEPLTPMEALKIIAVYRFLLPEKELKVAGGREAILRDLQSWIFFAGANSFLIGNYLTTFGRSTQQDHEMLRDLGIPFRTFEEVEHEAPDSVHPGPMSEGSLAKLPVVNG